MKNILLSVALMSAIFLPSVAVHATTKAEEEAAIDEALGILDNDWTVDTVTIKKISELPDEMRPGLPPYDQQPRDAGVLAPDNGGGTRSGP